MCQIKTSETMLMFYFATYGAQNVMVTWSTYLLCVFDPISLEILLKENKRLYRLPVADGKSPDMTSLSLMGMYCPQFLLWVRLLRFIPFFGKQGAFCDNPIVLAFQTNLVYF